VYIKIDPPPQIGDTNNGIFSGPGNSYGRWHAGALLGRSIDDLLEDMERATTASIMAETARIAAALADTTDNVGDIADGGGDAPAREVETQMWVDKYAPRVFTDLLSDEATNRQVLQWLKAWDSCVYGHKNGGGAGKSAAPMLGKGKRPAPPAGGMAAQAHKRPALPSSRRRGSAGGQPYDSAVNAAARSRAFALEREAANRPTVGEDGRPTERLLLMAGPPGLGKTTLAHIAAKHCGYRVVDINASDERGAAGLRGRVLDAMQMQSLLGADGRPNCIVLDEIDGAVAASDGRGAIDAVVALAKADSQASRVHAGPEGDHAEDDGPTGGHAGRRGGKASSTALIRPVLCICNDVNAAALRPLRDVARVFRFVPPTPARLAARLRDIAQLEGMRVEPRALTVLAERTHCDVRASLHALQLLHRSRSADGKQSSISTADVLAVVGEKDLTVGPMDAWRALFSRGASSLPGFKTTSASGKSGSNDFNATLALLQTVGDAQLVLAGVHENLACARYTDTLLHKTAAALSQLSDGDLFVGAAHSRGTWACMGYVPLTCMAVRALVATSGERPQLSWPHQAQAVPRDAAHKETVLAGWRAACVPSVRATLSSSAASDVVPYLLTILGPALRTMSVHAMAPAEREELEQLVQTMVAYGLTYTTRGATDATGVYTTELALDPPLETLVRCDGLDEPPPRRQLVQSMRQVVAHHCLVEHIKRTDLSRTARTLEGDMHVDTEEGGQQALQQKPENTAGLAAALMEKYNKAAGGSRKRPSYGGTGVATYKFHEGFTNAVRRAVFVRELL